MRARSFQHETTVVALDLHEPDGDTLYSLETMAALAGVSRRAVLIH